MNPGGTYMVHKKPIFLSTLELQGLISAERERVFSAPCYRYPLLSDVTKPPDDAAIFAHFSQR